MSLKSKIEKIVSAIKDSNISEIEITNFWGFQKIKLKTDLDNNKVHINPKPEADNGDDGNYQQGTVSSSAASVNDESVTRIDNDNTVDISDDIKDYTTITAPLVGTFYQAAKPGDKPFVEVGSKLKKGDSLCIIEAMKIFNTIESEFDGEIKEIFIQDGEPIEYGQALFSIDIN